MPEADKLSSVDYQPNHYDIAIIGTGPIGLLSALSFSLLKHQSRELAGLTIALIGQKPTPQQLERDTRTTAFMQPSLTMLENLGLLSDLTVNTAPLKALKMIDDTGGLFRAPDCYFNADELGLPYFALNIPNTELNKALLSKINAAKPITWIETDAVTQVTQAQSNVEITTSDEMRIHTSLLIGADGRNSICRKATTIKTNDWAYDQTAIACSFTHKNPHAATSVEIHRPTGPLTLIPLKEHHASLVWSLNPATAQNLLEISDDKFISRLYEKSLGFYGPIEAIGKRVAFPIKGMSLDRLAEGRIALVGEAAHVVPPIGAQGMNMGLMDIASLFDCIKERGIFSQHDARFKDPAVLISLYNESRLADIQRRTTTIDMLNKSLLLSYFPMKATRMIGLAALKKSPTLRKYIMQHGLGSPLTALSNPNGDACLPSLMQNSTNQSSPITAPAL